MYKPEFKTVMVTPEMASNLLKNNIGNRPISNRLLNRFIHDMTKGNWKINTGETIKISVTGKILDGQHRLIAIVKSGRTIQLHVVYGLDDEVFDVIDTGKSRSASDCFSIQNIKNSNTIPSMIQFRNMLKQGLRTTSNIDYTLTNAELIREYYLNENFWENIAKETLNFYKHFNRVLKPSFLGGFYSFLYEFDSIKSYAFMDQLTSGKNIQNHTIYLFRERLYADKISPNVMKQSTKIALTIKVWNFYITGKSVKKLSFDETREDSPIAINPNVKLF